MEEYKLNKNYYYQKYLTDIEMYEALDNYLKTGFFVKENVFLAILISNGTKDILLNYLDVPYSLNVKEDIKKLYQEIPLSMPDYSKTLLNLDSAIRKNFGYASTYPSIDNAFDKHYKHTIILLLDGMGTSVLENNLPADSFLRTHYAFSLNAIYPSTTAAATTSIISGEAPITTGWTGWENYLREIKRNIILFTGENYVTGEATGVNVFSYLPYEPFYADMKIKGSLIMPDFKTPNLSLKYVLERSLATANSCEEDIQYVYYTNPDSLMHEFGCDSEEAKIELASIDNLLIDYYSKLPADTILFISADHGHINCGPINLYACNSLIGMLERRPSNDGRCLTFKVKKEEEENFVKLFNGLYGSVYQLYKSEVAIKKEFFGPTCAIINPRTDDFFADYVALATNRYYFNYRGKGDFLFKSHHAGITKEEMLIPLCICRK